MALVKRFEIYLLNLDPEISGDAKNTRPCVVVSPDEMNRHISSVIVAPISSTDQKYPTRIPFEFLEKRRAVILDQIRSVEKERLVKNIGSLDKSARTLTVEILQEMFAL
jgi:mRNA interferase MazF